MFFFIWYAWLIHVGELMLCKLSQCPTPHTQTQSGCISSNLITQTSVAERQQVHLVPWKSIYPGGYRRAVWHESWWISQWANNISTVFFDAKPDKDWSKQEGHSSPDMIVKQPLLSLKSKQKIKQKHHADVTYFRARNKEAEVTDCVDQTHRAGCDSYLWFIFCKTSWAHRKCNTFILFSFSYTLANVEHTSKSAGGQISPPLTQKTKLRKSRTDLDVNIPQSMMTSDGAGERSGSGV